MRIRLLTMMAALTLITGAAFGQATRTWVSGVGDDVNPCSRTAPCKTFAGAISKTAARGQISVLDPGGYGAVTITKSITIDGAGTMGSILHSGVNGIVINAAVTDKVILRNLQIDGSSGIGPIGLNGISVVTNGAGTVIVQDCVIMNATKGISVTNSANTVNLYVTNTDITFQAQNGIALQPTGTGFVNAMFDNVRISRTGTLSTHDGVLQGANTNTHFKNTNVFRSTGAGLRLAGSFALSTIEDSSFIRNGSHGVHLDASATQIRVGNSTATQNTGSGFRATFGSIFSYRNNLSSDNGAADTANTQQAFY
jgi:hypothetical protein